MDLIKHFYHLGTEGFRFGEAHVRCNVCLFLFSRWISNIEISLYFFSKYSLIKHTLPLVQKSAVCIRECECVLVCVYCRTEQNYWTLW